MKPAPKLTHATSDTIEALFAELERDPGNEGTTLVLADALAERGDVRGDLFQVQRALASAPRGDRATFKQRETALLHALRQRLLGTKLASLPDIALEVRLGFARELCLFNLTPDVLAEALATVLPSPDARLLESLHIAWDAESAMGVDAVFRALVGEVRVPAALRRLTLGNAFVRDPDDRITGELEPPEDDDDEDDDDDDELDVGDHDSESLHAVLTLFPRLRELVLDLGLVPVSLGTLATKNLEVLTWITPRLTREEAAALGRCILPNLKRLELWIGAVYGPDDGEMHDGEVPGDDLEVLETVSPRDLWPTLNMLDRCPELRELAFGNCAQLGRLLGALRNRPLLGRLQVLELTHLTIDDADEIVDFMREAPRLRLVLDNADATDRVRDTLVRRLGARLSADWASEPVRFRYVSGYE